MNNEQPDEGLVMVRGTADGFVQQITAGPQYRGATSRPHCAGTDSGPTPMTSSSLRQALAPR